MAPATNLGAATPVAIGAGAERPPNRRRKPSDEAQAQNGDGRSPPADADAMTAKKINDAAAYIRSLAQLRGRNAEWAERRCARPSACRPTRR